MDGDAVEAEAWAYLAVRSLKGLPITFPGTTGVTGAADRRRAGAATAFPERLAISAGFTTQCRVPRDEWLSRSAVRHPAACAPPPSRRCDLSR